MTFLTNHVLLYIYTYNCSTGAINCTLLILVCGIP